MLRGALPVNSFTLTVSIDRSLQPILVLYTGLFKPNYFSIQFFLYLLISSDTVQNPISATIPAQKSPYFLRLGCQPSPVTVVVRPSMDHAELQRRAVKCLECPALRGAGESRNDPYGCPPIRKWRYDQENFGFMDVYGRYMYVSWGL